MQADDGNTYKYAVVRFAARPPSAGPSAGKADVSGGVGMEGKFTKLTSKNFTSSCGGTYNDNVVVTQTKRLALEYVKRAGAGESPGDTPTLYAVAKIQFLSKPPSEPVVSTPRESLVTPTARRVSYMVTLVTPDGSNSPEAMNMTIGSSGPKYTWAKTASGLTSAVLFADTKEEAETAAKDIESRNPGKYTAVISKIEGQVTSGNRKRKAQLVEGADTSGEE